MPCVIPKSSIVDFYSNGKIFVTGATGFVGKSLVEKLLRVCPDIDRIYVLIRVKKGKEPQTRLKEVFDDPIFGMIRKQQPDFEKKVTCIPGNIKLPRLGMSDDDFEFLTKEVTHVIHSAASVRFNEPLKSAIDINICGTLEVISFCRNCIRLKILAHVSTAYSHCVKDNIIEKFYDTPITGEDAVALSKIFDAEKLEQLCPELIKPWPNTYSFTKAIAENAVKEIGAAFPAIIFRPSIVMSTLKEPFTGWTDNIYGPTGVIFAVGAGVLRVLRADKYSEANLVPVDRTVNALLCSAWAVGSRYNNNNADVKNSLDSSKEPLANSEKRETLPKIFQFVSRKDNAITWNDFLRMNLYHGLKNPSQKAIWYYSLILTKPRSFYLFLFLVLHYIPGAIVDGALFLLGKKPQLTKAYNKIYNFGEAMEAFSLRDWDFSDNNIQNLWHGLSDTDKNLFDFNMSVINWDLYLNNVVKGVRLYIFRECEDTLPFARRRMFFFWLAHRFIQFCTVAFWFWILSKLYFLFRGFSEGPFEESILIKPELRNST